MINRKHTLALAAAAMFAFSGAAFAQGTSRQPYRDMAPEGSGLVKPGQREVVPQGDVTGTINPDPQGMATKADACARLYSSYDPQTNTFVGNDGMRHLCQ